MQDLRRTFADLDKTLPFLHAADHGGNRRRREIGIRLAVGVMLAAGLAGGIAATRAVRRLLSTVVTLRVERDGGALLALAGVFLAIALIAALLPARRAAKVDPMTSLRAE